MDQSGVGVSLTRFAGGAKKRFFTKQTLFYFGAVLMLFLEILWVVRSFSFLVRSLDAVFANESIQPASLQFDINGFESLDLIRK